MENWYLYFTNTLTFSANSGINLSASVQVYFLAIEVIIGWI